tara:strand:+ start:208 stop:483 length:276 start_codon:yes stop_codon:yes gene_type:complete
MPDYTREEDLHPEVKPLSKREAAWVARLEKTLLACPTDRIALAAWGDPILQVYDEGVTNKHRFEICDGGARENRVLLSSVSSRPIIDAVTN